MRSASPSSTSAVRLLAILALAGAGLALALAPGELLPAIASMAIAGPAALLIVFDVVRSERRRHEAVEHELAQEAATLEALIASFGAIAATRDPDAIPELVRREAERLFGGRAELIAARAEAPGAEGELLVPLRLGAGDEALVRLVPEQPPTRSGTARALMLGDFATRAHESARLRVEAQEREAERARLSDQLATAEQGERRRLALVLHDTSVQALSGIALMLDAVKQSLEAGREDEAQTVLDSALKRLRDAIRGLRELSFALEPVVLRDQGFGPAVTALVEQLGREGRIDFELDVVAAEALDENAKSALYQIVREALHSAIRRGPPGHVSVRVAETSDGFEAVIADDAPGERRRASFEPLVERARSVSGRVAIEGGNEAGTTVRVHLPAYAAR